MPLGNRIAWAAISGGFFVPGQDISAFIKMAIAGNNLVKSIVVSGKIVSEEVVIEDR